MRCSCKTALSLTPRILEPFTRTPSHLAACSILVFTISLSKNWAGNYVRHQLIFGGYPHNQPWSYFQLCNHHGGGGFSPPPLLDLYYYQGLNVKLPREKKSSGILCKENMAMDCDIETCFVVFFPAGMGELVTIFFSPFLAKEGVWRCARCSLAPPSEIGKEEKLHGP